MFLSSPVAGYLRVLGLGLRVQCLLFRVWGFGFRAQDLGLRVDPGCLGIRVRVTGPGLLGSQVQLHVLRLLRFGPTTSKIQVYPQ